VQTALTVAERDGLENLTMRSLAAELGVTQMAAYYYLRSKDELLDLVMDAAVASVVVPSADDGPWDVRLKLLCKRQFEAIRRFKGLSGHSAKAKLGPEQLRIFEGYISIFEDAGMDPDNAMRAFAMVHTYMLGRQVLSDRLRGPARKRMERFLGERATKDAGATLIDFALDAMIEGLRPLVGEALPHDTLSAVPATS
jgi:AcrR family transcriptional regulator